LISNLLYLTFDALLDTSSLEPIYLSQQPSFIQTTSLISNVAFKTITFLLPSSFSIILIPIYLFHICLLSIVINLTFARYYFDEEPTSTGIFAFLIGLEYQQLLT